MELPQKQDMVHACQSVVQLVAPAFFFTYLPVIFLRKKTMEKYNIEENGNNSILAGLFCLPCSWWQTAQEIKTREEMETLCCTCNYCFILNIA